LCFSFDLLNLSFPAFLGFCLFSQNFNILNFSFTLLTFSSRAWTDFLHSTVCLNPL
jgi:hypothetical protein